MSRQDCLQKLEDAALQKDFSTADLLAITEDARGGDAAQCFRDVGGSAAILRFLEKIRAEKDAGLDSPVAIGAGTEIDETMSGEEIENPQESWEKSEESSGTGEAVVGVAEPTRGEQVSGWFSWRDRGIFWWILGGIAILWGVRKILPILHDIFATKRLVYLKISMPKSDSKSDMEKNKEIAKDMKERISRMTQVFMARHAVGELSFLDKVWTFLFEKAKISVMYHFEGGKLSFIVSTYPEYVDMVTSTIDSQYSDAAIEEIEKPSFLGKKFSEVLPLSPEKDSVFTIKTYQHSNDDQINNLIDALSSTSRQDTASIVLTFSPESDSWNKIAQKKIGLLYKEIDISSGLRGRIKKFWWFLIGSKNDAKDPENVTMVRMLKSKEDTLNAMGTQAGLPAFRASLMLVASSDSSAFSVSKSIENLWTAMSVYTDERGNEFTRSAIQKDVLGFLFGRLWKFAFRFRSIGLFHREHILSVEELTSLFHFPIKIFNPSGIIDRLPYKVLPAPQELPKFGDATEKMIGGFVAEGFKKGDITTILGLPEYKNHWAVGERVETTEELVPLGKNTPRDGEIVEKDWAKFVKKAVEKTVRGFKIFREGVLLGVNVHKNTFTPIYMKRKDRTRHFYCIGKSGTGKSVFLQTMARQDVWNGDGLCLIDPHGDLAEDMLEYIPKERAKDVIFFDAGNEERPMGLNLYEIKTLDEADRAVNDATEIFLKMFGPEIFGPRIQEYFKYGSLTLMEDFEDRPTLLDVTRLYTDESYRNYKTKKVTQPVVKNFWEKTYNAMGDREKAEIIPYFSSKFVSFNTNRLIRNIIGQTQSAFDIEDVMNKKKILLISLSKGKIGELNAQLLGMILVSKIYNGAMARARMPEEERKDFYLYVDEFQNFVSGTFADILSEARKYRLGLIMAHQYIGQLEGGSGNNVGEKYQGGKGDVKSAVFGNVGTMMSFKVGAPDAEFLEKEYAPDLSASDIVGISNYKAYVKLNVNNTTSRPFSMTSIYSKDFRNKKVPPILKEYSAKKYGRKREFVDAEIRARLGLTVADEEIKKLGAVEQPKLPNPPTVRPGEETPAAAPDRPVSENSQENATKNEDGNSADGNQKNQEKSGESTV